MNFETEFFNIHLFDIKKNDVQKIFFNFFEKKYR